jgi:alkylhydroperoxidase family enzyme
MAQQQATKEEAGGKVVPSAELGHASEGLRLKPYDKPKGLMLRLVYWMAPRQFGKVPTNIRVIATRAPKTMKIFSALGNYEMKGVRLDKELHYLLLMFVSTTNGCGFCVDFGRMMVFKEKMNTEKFNALPDYQTNRLFSVRERAALAYAEEVTKTKRVSDGTFEELRRHFADWEIVEIATLTAIQNFENMLFIPLGIGSDGLCAIAQARKK